MILKRSKKTSDDRWISITVREYQHLFEGNEKFETVKYAFNIILKTLTLAFVSSALLLLMYYGFWWAASEPIVR